MAVALTARPEATVLDPTDKVYIVQNGVGKFITIANLLKEANLTFSDIPNGDASITKHGFLDKLPNDNTKFKRGDGTWAVPSAVATLPNHTIMEAGDDWADVVSNYNASAAGGVIWLPPGEIIQTSALQIKKSIHFFGHPDGTSKIKIQANLPLHGSNRQFFIDADYPNSTAPVDGVTFAGFEIEHDRAAMGSSGRQLTIDFGMAKNVNIRNMRFTNITADVFHFSVWRWIFTATPLVENVNISNCVVDEWYESVFNFHGAGSNSRGGTIKNVHINNVVATTTAAHPNTSVSKPYGFLFESTAPMLLEDIYLNKCILTGAGNLINSFGIFINVEGSPNPFYRYDKIHCNGNIVSGFTNALLVRNGQSVGGNIAAGPSRMTFNDNTFSTSATLDEHPIVRLFPAGVAATDTLALMGNTIIRANGGQPTIDEPAHTGAVSTKVKNTII